MKNIRKVLPEECVGVTGVTLYFYGKKLDKKFSSGTKSGKCLLLTPDFKLVVAVSDNPQAMYCFIEKNNLKEYVCVINPGSKDQLVY